MRKGWFLSAAVAASAAFAAPVSTNEAATAVANWLASGQAMGCTGMGGVAGVEAYNAKGGTGRFYVISLRNDEGSAAGYVVTSTDSRMNPVLAYSESGTFEATEKNPLWVMLGIDVPGATKAMEAAAAAGGARLASAAGLGANERKWAALLSGARLQGTSRSSISDVRVNTLLETRWGQSGHGENYYTPRSYVCGCVATAGAQIMRYWKHPTAAVTAIKNYSGTAGASDILWNLNDGYQTSAGGAYTAWSVAFGGPYDWSNMPAAGASSSWFSLNKTQADAIGRLTLDVGRSVHMSYESDGSGSHYSLLSARLTDQFQYANANLLIKNCGEDEIKRGILCSLDLKSPCGVSVPGHAIVADGYGYNADTLYVHFNFGWSGTDNAWYSPPDLSDADSGFTSIDTIIYNIYPPSVCSESGRSILSGRVLNTSGGAVSGVTVTAHKGSSAYTATTDSKGIYALLVPAGTYAVKSSNGNMASVSTNVAVAACSSTRLANETGGSYYPGGSIGNVHGVELVLDQPIVTAAAPVFAPKSGTVFFRNDQPVAISCATEGAQIRYTIDGTEPTESSALYAGSILISSSATVKARAYLDGGKPSGVASASYSRRAIIGENLVLNTSPAQGEVQTLSVAAPGTYSASFDYAGVAGRYGERMELRLAKDGETNTLASVAAASSGTSATNFTFDVSEAGDWDLFLYNPANGATQPVTFSNLSIYIPTTPENLSRYWIYETEGTFGATGEWEGCAGFQDGGLMTDEGRCTFTPHRRQEGRRVTMTFLMSFNSVAEETTDIDPPPKAAIQIARDASGRNVFQVLTSSEGEPVWRKVRAEGVEEPSLDVQYTVKFVLDCTNMTYTAALVDGDAELPLTAESASSFAFANASSAPVAEVAFEGSGSVAGLHGIYDDPVAAFAEGDVLALAHGAASTTLTAAQAAWLNSMDAYAAVKAKVGEMDAGAFADAWLLNLDLREESSAQGALKVTGIEVTETEVRITVKLERAGAMKAAGDVKDAAINGVMRLYGGTALGGAMAPLNETPVTNEDFADGDTALFVYPRGGGAKFFRPAIRQR